MISGSYKSLFVNCSQKRFFERKLTHREFFLLHIFLKLNGTFTKTLGGNVPKKHFFDFQNYISSKFCFTFKFTIKKYLFCYTQKNKMKI